MIRSIQFLILLSLFGGFLAPAEAKFDPTPIVREAVRSTMNEVFLHLYNRQKEFKTTLDFVNAAFGKSDLTEKQIKDLKKLPAPKIYLVKDGIVLELEKHKAEFVLNDSADGIILRELGEKTSHFQIFWNQAYAEPITLTAGAIIFLKTVALPFLGRLVLRAAIGAAVGCGASMAWQSGEEKFGQACKEGAIAGAPTFLYPFGIFAAARNGHRLAQIAAATGIAAAAALTAYDANELAKMNGSIVTCNGGGDFTMSVSRQGLSGRTLYEVKDGKLIFYLQTESDFAKDFTVEQEPVKLSAFFKEKNVFPGLTDQTLRQTADAVLTEVRTFSAFCSSQRPGYWKRLWSSEGDGIQQPPSSRGTR